MSPPFYLSKETDHGSWHGIGPDSDQFGSSLRLLPEESLARIGGGVGVVEQRIFEADGA